MTALEESIRGLFAMRRHYEADQILLEQIRISKEQEDANQPAQERIARALGTIQGFLALLPEDERFVIQRHLIDGIDWTRIGAEYEMKWGRTHGKERRTLMSYQKRGLTRIAAYINEREGRCDFSWLTAP